MVKNIFMLYTRTTLAARYGITTTSLKEWYSPAGVIPPRKKGGFFKEIDIEQLDFLCIATRYVKVTKNEYQLNVLPMGGLSEYVLSSHKIPLKDFLLDPKYVNQEDEVVIEVLRRLENDAAYQSSGFTVESAA
ncbi:hypothetical protein DSM106972_048800 [Dulcicalothrix desertica PCC 7102]|uniref:Uncharacterized protein n=1 Tax=Dulcicalothrix desertica PCC 7102 TaxID=232991 RepID=A0A3S1ALK8_9CYAN|nr:hypothetical protein [Dulcicalothrix desertica]RUT03966.1 hypothetical protein DSM106972_048800 [Dulcicalothrix desertica PCC 7102]TWH43627.1 hypothetical protein CAL7102_07364 [Dulcicalothrix desertica PCC 7102]